MQAIQEEPHWVVPILREARKDPKVEEQWKERWGAPFIRSLNEQFQEEEPKSEPELWEDCNKSAN